MPTIGIDPGKNGGIAWIVDGVARAERMPDTERDTWLLIASLAFRDTHCWIERVSSSPQMGVTSSFTFGRGYGQLTMALTAAGIPYEFVTPAKWQRTLGCLSKGDKNVTKAAAQRLFPEMKITHSISDSLLIAEYGRRIQAGAENS